MDEKRILVVDDERNIRLTMSQALESLEIPVLTAVNGEEALAKLREGACGLIFLDLKMPGMDGMEALRRIRGEWPAARVVIISAHGTIDSAVEALKLGAVDFIQKPFSPVEIRELATRVMERDANQKEHPADYRALIEQSRQHILNRQHTAAHESVRDAIAVDPARPEAYNLLGALLEIKGEWLSAQKFYRAALDIDPTFRAASVNLERTVSWNKRGAIDLGQDTAAETSRRGRA
jgi:DNA-binding response OmpR family regulator